MIAVYTSGHGFGHASRDIELLNALRRRRADLAVTMRTAVPAWLFEGATDRPFDIHPLETDPGIVQHDSLTLDEAETARRAVRFYETFDERVAAEAAWLRTSDASLVVADVPPLACAAAARADIPSVVVANFTWDWIYRGFAHFERQAPAVLPVLERAYAATTLALRLPLHGGFEPMAAVVRDIPFIARRSSHTRRSARAALGVTSERPIVLASFGGHGLRMPYEHVAREGRFTLVMTEFETAWNRALAGVPNLVVLSPQDLSARHLRYEDLVAAADVVVSKPGYGIVSECIANGAALLYTSRGRMVEYDVFVETMPRLLKCRFIAQDDLLAGRWADAIDALLGQAAAPVRPMTNGADVAADVIVKLAS